jgi:hypothetical protein
MDIFVEVFFSEVAEVDAPTEAENMREDDVVDIGSVGLVVETLLSAVVVAAAASAEAVTADASSGFVCVVVVCNENDSLVVVDAVAENANGGPNPVSPVTVWVTSTTVSCVMMIARDRGKIKAQKTTNFMTRGDNGDATEHKSILGTVRKRSHCALECARCYPHRSVTER